MHAFLRSASSPSVKLPHPFTSQQYAVNKVDEFPLKLIAWDQLIRSLPHSVSVHILYHQVAVCASVCELKSPSVDIPLGIKRILLIWRTMKHPGV